MENKNPEKKRLDIILKEADVQGMKVVLVESPVICGHHRIEALIKSEDFMVIAVGNLPKEDDLHVAQIFAEAKQKTGKNPFEPEPFKFNAPRIEDLIMEIPRIEEEKISEPKVNIPAIAKKHDFARMKGNRTVSKPLPKKVLGFRGRR